MLLTTTQAFCFIDLGRRCARCVDRGNGVYYGITYSEDRIFVAARRAAYGSAPAAQKGVILCFDRRLDWIETLEPPFPLRDLHQIEWFDDKLWVCGTYDDLVAVWDGQAWDRWYPLPLPENPSEFNHYHLNSIFALKGEILMVGNKNHTGTIYRFNRHSREEIGRRPLGTGSHNVWSEGHEIFTLSSASGEVLSTSGRSHFLGNFVRGIVVDEHRRYVGVSEVSRRRKRAQSHCSILVMDSNWNHLETNSIRGHGMVHDLRATELLDQAHTEDVAFDLEPDCWERFPAIDLVDHRLFARPLRQWLKHHRHKFLGA